MYRLWVDGGLGRGVNELIEGLRTMTRCLRAAANGGKDREVVTVGSHLQRLLLVETSSFSARLSSLRRAFRRSPAVRGRRSLSCGKGRAVV